MISLSQIYSHSANGIEISTLLRGLPGVVGFSINPSASEQEEIVEIFGDSPETRKRKYDCKFAFNRSAGAQEATIKNFSIHDPEERGKGLGAMVIANLIDTAEKHGIKSISLTAELERGAFVWAKLGWKPTQTSFTKLQKRCQPKLDVLQQLLPEDGELSAINYGIFRDLLDAETTTDPKYIWAIVDSGASYKLDNLLEIQKVSNIQDTTERLARIRELVSHNGINLSEVEITQNDKILRFIKNIDLCGLSRDGKVSVSALLFSWEQWKGTLELSDDVQVQRIEQHLKGARQSMLYYSPDSSHANQFPLVQASHG